MFDGGDLSYIRRAINRNEAVLFLGAGFSRDGINRVGAPLPLTNDLCKLLWKYLDYKDEWDGSTSLQILFDNALKKGHDGLKDLLTQHLEVVDAPLWYDLIVKPYWYRIYSTNIDNIVEFVYNRSTGWIRKLAVKSGTTDDYEERDQFLNTIQYIKLHGDLAGPIDRLTFSRAQYASRAAQQHDAWYDHFIRDHATHPTIFVGTILNEPLFYQYLSIREGKFTGEGVLPDFPERRLKSYLISPNVPRPIVESLKEFNIAYVDTSAKDFFEWLFSQIEPLDDRIEVLKSKLPDLALALRNAGHSLAPHQKAALEDFYGVFRRPPTLSPKQGHPKNYLLGFAPGWQDLVNNLDAPREIVGSVYGQTTAAFQAPHFRVISLIGSAGSGKTTTLMRLALQLHQEGYGVFFCDGVSLPSMRSVEIVVSLLQERAIMVIDNAELIAPLIPDFFTTLRRLTKPPIVVLGSQANLYERIERRLTDDVRPEIITLPNLSARDIDNILIVLTRTGLLGVLQGLSKQNQIDAFVRRARSQILVAMKEATSGLGFDEIIYKEYQDIEPINARILLLCVALATTEGHTLSKGQFVACSETSAFETLGYLDRNLRDVVIVDSNNNEQLSARHPLIAKQIVEVSASKEELCSAYIRLLQTLAHDINPQHPKKSKALFLYQRIIIHKTIHQRFENTIHHSRSIYEAIKELLSKDWQFWLQYGSLELEYGDLQLAENYLNQAFKLNPNHNFITHARAHLWLRQAITAHNLSEACQLRTRAEEALVAQIEDVQVTDPYPYHILCSQLLNWIRRWFQDTADKKRELLKLKKYIAEACDRFPLNEKLKKLNEEIQYEYLRLGVSRSAAEGEAPHG